MKQKCINCSHCWKGLAQKPMYLCSHYGNAEVVKGGGGIVVFKQLTNITRFIHCKFYKNKEK